MPEQLPEELQKSLIQIFDLCDKEDLEIRKAQIRQWKKYEEFWHGVQYLFWSARDEAWKSPLNYNWNDELSEEELQEVGSFYDYVIDIFKAHGESIIAALSSQVPVLRFIPDDADNDADVQTARTYNKISDIICRHNKAKLLLIRAFFFLYINGVLAAYRYKDSDEKYGTFKVPSYAVQEIEETKLTCPECDADREAGSPCVVCGSEEPSVEAKVPTQVKVRGEDKVFPKTRVKIDLYGGLSFKVPVYARNQSECGYLIHYDEPARDALMDAYCGQGKDFDEELYKKIQGASVDTADRFSRSSFTFPTDYDTGLRSIVARKRIWLRPQKFWLEDDKDKREKLLKLFPKGCKVVIIGKENIFIEAAEENLDDRWTLGQASLGTYFHTDALCRPVVSVQELRNDLVNITKETIDHGVPSSFADPSVVNFDEYGKFEALPGFLYKAKPTSPSNPLQNSFYTSDRATLSKEVPMFFRQLDEDAQFSLGSFPSIYGGPSEGKSRTFAEYAASRQMALQRLSIAWTLAVDWWTTLIRGCADLYVETVIEDQKFPIWKDGSFINVWIRKAELNGKIGGVEPESSEDFPMSLMQKRDLLVKLIELNNEFVNSALYTPENSRILQDALALNEFKIPGETDRIKQVQEINELIKTEPENVSEDPMQEQFASTVSIDLDIDDHEVHIATCKAFLKDQIGLALKEENPAAYMNVVYHMKEHQAALMQQTLTASPTAPMPGEMPDTTQGAPE